MTTTETREVGSVPNTAAEILSAVQGLAPSLRARSVEIEEARRMPADIVEMLRAAGVFRMGFSAEFGGPNLTSMEQTRVLEELARADASVGWCGMIGMDSGLYSAYLTPDAVRELFPTPDTITGGMVQPNGRAERVPGGYMLTGKYSLGSGITHADRISAGALTCTDGQVDINPTGNPNWIVTVLAPEDVKMIDTWNSTGLAGSGSIHYEVDGVFVPEQHVFNFSRPKSRSGPLSAPDALMRKMPGVPLGTARAALDYARAVISEKTNSQTGQAWKDHYRAQFVLGQCEMDYLTIRHAVYGSLEHKWQLLNGDATYPDLTPDERVGSVLIALKAFRESLSIVRRLYDLLATASIYKPSLLDRSMRDLTTMCQHVMAQDVIVQSAGAHFLGGEPGFPFALGITE
ncbi:MAG: acyl-CoA dehydrogenase [Rhodococcus sp.]|uniref:acyl-CoA dehydrogenase family protein n=1 Tax=Rhodococcus sp. TaxID=1831 RepID=UPI0016A7DA15|nr:acyl-CoA dehydrogenase family protein [Rhodococcus sp. (in: high G+C Gram-positive bacteria)]NLV79648.1 acyl-CoA dehydrogenase [Rhodococcus sp. (in: high G+C Gram-positive bacteria)]